MNTSRCTKGTIILLAFVLCFLCGSPLITLAKAMRGDAPHCQEECLARHSERMRQLSEQYLKTGNKMEYQDRVGEEVLQYSRCLTDCREVLPIK
jgi:hypothetical protein